MFPTTSNASDGSCVLIPTLPASLRYNMFSLIALLNLKFSPLPVALEQLKSISKNARKFIEEHHDYINIANKYLKTWKTK